MFIRNGRTISKAKSNHKDIILPATEERLISTNALLASYGAGSFQTHYETETIAYTNRDPARPGAANFCIHKHVIADYPYDGPLVMQHHSAASPTRYTTDSVYTGWMASAHPLGVSAAKSAFGVNLGDAVLGVNGSSYIWSGYDKMRPDLTEVSVPNFLWEITQLKSLVDLWSSRRSASSNFANLNLTWGFGWRPTISDVNAILTSVINLQARLRQWNNSLGRTVSKRVTVLKNSISKSGAILGQPHSRFTTNWTGNLDQTVTAHIVYRPLPLKVLTDTEKLLRGYLDSLGFELNPEILWDAVPFSFIVDWFIPIGNMLSRLTLDTLELPFKLEDSYLQFKEVAKFSSKIRDNGDANYPARSFPASVSEEHMFQRMLILPRMEDWTSLGWKLPNLKQLTYAISLGFK